MSNSYFIALTLGMAAVTFLIRFSFIGLAGKIQMSERVTKTLRFVPVTVLPAIITIQILCGEVIVSACVDHCREKRAKPYGTRLWAGQAVSARLVGK